MPNDIKTDSAQPGSLHPAGYANGKSSWVEWIESASKSADRYGDRDVVPASMATELAARLDECYRDRAERHNDKVSHSRE